MNTHTNQRINRIYNFHFLDFIIVNLQSLYTCMVNFLIKSIMINFNWHKRKFTQMLNTQTYTRQKISLSFSLINLFINQSNNNKNNNNDDDDNTYDNDLIILIAYLEWIIFVCVHVYMHFLSVYELKLSVCVNANPVIVCSLHTNYFVGNW